MLTMERPTVILPLPDSPTSPSVSPCPRTNETPSTAWTSPVLRSSKPPCTGNLTCRSLTSRIGGMFVGDSVEVAANEVPGRPLHQGRLDVRARLEAIRASGRELATDGQIKDVGDRARDGCQPLGPLAVDSRQRSEQAP